MCCGPDFFFGQEEPEAGSKEAPAIAAKSEPGDPSSPPEILAFNFCSSDSEFAALSLALIGVVASLLSTSVGSSAFLRKTSQCGPDQQIGLWTLN